MDETIEKIREMCGELVDLEVRLRGAADDIEDSGIDSEAYEVVIARSRDVLRMLTGSQSPSILDCGGDGPLYQLALALEGL